MFGPDRATQGDALVQRLESEIERLRVALQFAMEFKIMDGNGESTPCAAAAAPARTTRTYSASNQQSGEPQ